ncbi:MAG TPA: hypothetical protein PK156_39920 [Polyangium sp.]|nr:hypothetical protein [Polyangium sp.]
MMNHRFHVLYVMALVAMLPGCTTDDRDPPVEEPIKEPMEDPTKGKADYDTFLTCASPTCKGWAQRIEGGTPFSMYDMACVVQAMRDRTPGMYGVKLNHTFSNGQNNGEYSLLIGPSGDVTVGVYYSGDYGTPPLDESWDPIRKCSLLAVDYFDACLAAVEMGQGPDAPMEAWNCVFPRETTYHPELPWFAACADVAPTCP